MTEDPAAAVLAAAEARATALAHRDPAALRRLLHPEFRWTSFRGDTFGRDAYVAANTVGSQRWLAQRLEDPRVTVVGSTAVITGVVVDVVQRNGNKEEYRLRLTQTWVRDERGWRCLAGHVGPPVN